MKRALLPIIVVALYVLHQDFWFWRAARPLVFGFIPIGLFYHACYTVAAALLMWMLVKHAWPSHLEEEIEGGAGFSLRDSNPVVIEQAELDHRLKSAPRGREGEQ
ncbi:MAG: DUF3311 domain-containing protein [Acidobacteriota bacterium]